MSWSRRESVEKPLSLRSDPIVLFTEAFRTLRSHLLMMLREGHKAFLITSTGPGEGKSTISVKLAQVMAAGKKRVLLVDADLRRPTLDALLGLPNEHGLTELLMGTVDPQDVYQHLASGLTVVTSGALPSDPQQLLLGGNLEKVVRLLKNDFDVLLLDSAPVLAFEDTSLLARSVDGVILVLKYGAVNTAEALLVRKRLRSIRARQVGCVISFMPQLYMQPYHPYINQYIAKAEPKPRNLTRIVANSLLIVAGLLVIGAVWKAASLVTIANEAARPDAVTQLKKVEEVAIPSAPVLQVSQPNVASSILPAGPTTIEKLSVGCERAQPCIIINTRGKAALPNVTTLPGPDRVVMDFQDAMFSPEVQRLQVGRGAVKAVRFGENAGQPPRARVVIDLTERCDFELQTLTNRVIVNVYRKSTARPKG